MAAFLLTRPRGDYTQPQLGNGRCPAAFAELGETQARAWPRTEQHEELGLGVA